MKRFHVHVVVDDLEKSIPFYSAVFAQEPTVRKADYAKWLVEDPRVNFAISTRNVRRGINHLGLQADNTEELGELHGRLQQADRKIIAEEGVSCCYSRSDKYWITDPQGIAWETFHSLGDVPLYAGDSATAPACGASTPDSSCCPSTEDAAATSGSQPAVCCPAA